MKTVKQLADEIGINVQTVYRRIDKISKNSNEVLTEKVNNITYLTDRGEKLVSACLAPAKQPLNTVKQAESAEIVFLREQIKELNAKNDVLSKELTAEREHSRQQSDKITALAESLSRLTENGQVLLREQNLKTLPPSAPEKISLWKKIFKRKN